MLPQGSTFQKAAPSSPAPSVPPCPRSGDTDFNLPPQHVLCHHEAPPCFSPSPLLSSCTSPDSPLLLCCLASLAEAVAPRMRTHALIAFHPSAPVCIVRTFISSIRVHRAPARSGCRGREGRGAEKEKKPPPPPSLWGKETPARRPKRMLRDTPSSPPHPPHPRSSSHSLRWDRPSWAPNQLLEDFIPSSLSLPPSPSEYRATG